MKRILDVTLAAVGLALLAPLLLVVAAVIKLSSRGPVLFAQERVGLGFAPFRILKFRTMRWGAGGPGVTGPGDPRVTPVGRFLRDTKLDELPQLWNVLRGDMSLVGPRPELARFVRLFADEFHAILSVRPGITDPASIVYRNESALLPREDPEAEYVRTVLPHKIRLARHYVRRASLSYDLRILLETLLRLAYPARIVDRLFERLGRHHEPLAIAFQVCLAAAANLAALLLRFDGAPAPEATRQVLHALPVLVGIRACWLWRFRLHRDIWRYFGLRELGSIVVATALGSATFHASLTWLRLDPLYPPSIVILDAMLCVAALAGVRVARCVHDRLHHRQLTTRSVLLVGGRDSAERFLLDRSSPSRDNNRIVGLVTDGPQAHGLRIHDVPIVGGLDQLDGILSSQLPDEIVVLASGLPAARRGEAIQRCRASGRPVKVVPDLDDILRRDLSVLRLGQPQAEDVLFREPVRVDPDQIRSAFADRRVLVTGAGGSIGSEICRQIAACSPARLVMLDIHEESLYQIDRELRARDPNARVEAAIGDINDAARVDGILEATRPEFVFHAAAYKHVPMMERNPAEAYRTNVMGTKRLAAAAAGAGVATFVLISTDKAVEPASVMGASKRLAELAVQRLAAHSATRFLTVRFGNVLESSGSVIPLFREQIERGGPVTVTHRDMTRWFMTVSEAVHLLLQSVRLGSGGEVFVLDMGKPVRIVDVARALIRQYGLRPGVDVRIVFTGLRPGERLYERLFNDHERIWKTAHPRILKAADAIANGAGEARRADEARRLMRFFRGPVVTGRAPLRLREGVATRAADEKSVAHG